MPFLFGVNNLEAGWLEGGSKGSLRFPAVAERRRGVI